MNENKHKQLHSAASSPVERAEGEIGSHFRLLPFFDKDWWQEIWVTITHNKSRSILTAFGVFWGMFMLVVMMGAGNALQNGIMSQVEGFATNSCFFQANRTVEPYKGFRKGRTWEITSEDVAIIKHKVQEIQYLAPVLFGGRRDNNTVHGEKTGSYNVMGHYPEFNLIAANSLANGRYINDIDILEKRKVCVIGKRVYEELFSPGENPLGKNIQANGIFFQVIGVIERMSDMQIFGDVEASVILPFTTLQQAFNQGNKVHVLAVTADSDVKVKDVQEKISMELKSLHDISPTDTNAVWSLNMEEQFNMFTYLTFGVSVLIWIVGLGTLFAGGIGISNIMLVTVRERTKEIGIRRALGATPRNIIIQIMSESVVLTIIAGIAGLMIGVGLLQLVDIGLSQGDQFFKSPQVSFGISIAALFILLLIGTLAGYMPARRAMDIKPIEAIREE